MDKWDLFHEWKLGLTFNINHHINKLKRNLKKINKWEYIRLKIFYRVEETINKRPPTEWEKAFTNDIIKIYKELIQLYIKKKAT